MWIWISQLGKKIWADRLTLLTIRCVDGFSSFNWCDWSVSFWLFYHDLTPCVNPEHQQVVVANQLLMIEWDDNGGGISTSSRRLFWYYYNIICVKKYHKNVDKRNYRIQAITLMGDVGMSWFLRVTLVTNRLPGTNSKPL